MSIDLFDLYPPARRPGRAGPVASRRRKTATISVIDYDADGTELVYREQYPLDFYREKRQLLDADGNEIHSWTRFEFRVAADDPVIRPGMQLVIAESLALDDPLFADYVSIVTFKPSRPAGVTMVQPPASVYDDKHEARRWIDQFDYDYWLEQPATIAAILDTQVPPRRQRNNPILLGVCKDLNACLLALMEAPLLQRLLQRIEDGQQLINPGSHDPRRSDPPLRTNREPLRSIDLNSAFASACRQALAGLSDEVFARRQTRYQQVAVKFQVVFRLLDNLHNYYRRYQRATKDDGQVQTYQDDLEYTADEALSQLDGEEQEYFASVEDVQRLLIRAAEAERENQDLLVLAYCRRALVITQELPEDELPSGLPGRLMQRVHELERHLQDHAWAT